MRKNISILLGASLLATAFAVPAASAVPTTIAVYGDAPYGTTPTETAQFDATPAFIDAVNADPDVSLVLHVGDIHSGKQYCTEAYDRSVYYLWSNFQDPLVYTPGDNEWADCHKKKEGGGTYNSTTGQIDYVTDASGNLVDYAGGDPIQNLDLVRSIFFANPGYTLGGSMKVKSQAQEFDEHHQTDRKYVENVWWEMEVASSAKILFVTLNIPGGSNNGSDIWYGAPTMTQVQQDEISQRTGATLRWLDHIFKTRGKSKEIKAVVIQTQADMWDLDGTLPKDGHIAKYQPFIDSIAAHTLEFGKPVLLLNGDSHLYRSDNPLVAGAPCEIEGAACTDDAYANQPHGYNVPNFHRVVVHGSTTPLEYIKLTIDWKDRRPDGLNKFGPFSWVRIQP